MLLFFVFAMGPMLYTFLQNGGSSALSDLLEECINPIENLHTDGGLCFPTATVFAGAESQLDDAVAAETVVLPVTFAKFAIPTSGSHRYQGVKFIVGEDLCININSNFTMNGASGFGVPVRTVVFNEDAFNQCVAREMPILDVNGGFDKHCINALQTFDVDSNHAPGSDTSFTHTFTNENTFGYGLTEGGVYYLVHFLDSSVASGNTAIDVKTTIVAKCDHTDTLVNPY